MSIRVYKDINLSTYEDMYDLDWSRKLNKNFTKLHSISSYFAMFCPSLPKYFVEKYTIANDLVMDNFSGRGTTALVCRQMNRSFIGTELNPYAYVLSKFKISSKLKINKIINRINELESQFLNNKHFWLKKIKLKEYKELLNFYHTDVLSQLLFIRESIGTNWLKNNVIDNSILAITLGIMHGRSKKNGDTIYFSIDMPNTISMSPNYVKNYAKKHKLKKPNLNVFKNILNRLISKFDENILSKKYNGKILFDNAVKKNKKIKNNSVSLVITSPPYLSIVDYKISNWLKLWLLGYNRNDLKNKIILSDKLNYQGYVNFIKQYLNSIHSKLKNRGKVCLVVGDVYNKTLIEDVWKEISTNVNYNFVEIYYDKKYLQNNKVSNMLNSKKGKATLIEKVLVLEKK